MDQMLTAVSSVVILAGLVCCTLLLRYLANGRKSTTAPPFDAEKAAKVLSDMVRTEVDRAIDAQRKRQEREPRPAAAPGALSPDGIAELFDFYQKLQGREE